MQHPSYAMFWCHFCSCSLSLGANGSKLRLGCSCMGSTLLPTPPALQCSLSWEQPPVLRYHVAEILASSRSELFLLPRLVPLAPGRPFGEKWRVVPGAAHGEPRNSPGLGLQPASPSFSQRLWATASENPGRMLFHRIEILWDPGLFQGFSPPPAHWAQVNT